MKKHLEILKNLVAYNTVNNPIENQIPSRDILDHINENYLQPLGYCSEFYEKEDYWSLFSYLERGSPVILFIGHCDVVPIGPNWETDPFDLTLKEERAYGRGASDMKGAVAVMLSLAEEFRDYNKGTIIYTINLDEESGGRNGAGELITLLQQKNLEPDYVINGDANGLQIINRRRNPYISSFKLAKKIQQIKGIKKVEKFTTKIAADRTMHAAYFMRDIDVHCADEVSDFLSENSYFIHKLRGSFVKNNVLPSDITIEYIIPDEKSNQTHDVDMNLTKFISSVSKFNDIDIPSAPSDYGINLTFNYYREEKEYHLCQMDLRIMSKDHKAVENYFLNFADSEGIEAEIKTKGSVGPVLTPKESPLVQVCMQVAREMNLTPEPMEMGGATDSRWFSAINIPSIEFGPLGGNVHGANEYIEINSLVTVKEFYFRIYEKLVVEHKEK